MSKLLRVRHHLISVLLIAVATFAYGQSTSFERISIKNGLSQNSVQKVVQDKNGFIWIATEDGLNRHDGYSFEVFNDKSSESSTLNHNSISDLSLSEDGGKLWIATLRGVDIIDINDFTIEHFGNNKDINHIIPDNIINCILHDSENRVWIGTIEGLNVFDLKSQSLISFQHDPSNFQSISNNNVTAIHEDIEGNIWIGTSAGLNKVSTIHNNSLTLKRYANTFLSNNRVVSIFQDSSSQIWVGTENGLNIIDPTTDKIKHLFNNPDNTLSLSDNRVSCTYEDSDNNIWVGTRNGLNRLKGRDLFEPEFERFYTDNTDVYSLSNNWISSIFEDNTGVLWIGTYLGGISKLRIFGKEFYNYKNHSDNQNSISSNIIRSIAKDSESQTLWIGTNPGLNKVDLSTGKITRYLSDSKSKNGLNNDIIRSLCIDDDDNLWIGTGRGGINILNPKTEKFTYMTHDSLSVDGFKGRDIRTLFNDSKGYIWAGSNESGLNKINPKTGEVINFIPDPDDLNSISSKSIFHLAEDCIGNLWIATYGGLNYYERKTNKFTRYLHEKGNPSSIPNNYIKTILINKKGEVWIGSTGGGITKLINRDDRIFKTYSSLDGLANDFIYGLLEDEAGYIWASSNRGIIRFDPKNESSISFESNDGIQGSEFNTGAYFGSMNGEMYFGGLNGLTTFHPDCIKFNKTKPKVTITDIQIFNKSIFNRRNKHLSKLLNTLSQDSVLALTYKENVVSFEFSALDYSSPLKNKYAYKMEGFDKEWIYTNASKRFTTYTNLPAGDYTFLIKGSNNDGVWSDKDYNLKIRITPPFYKDTWFLIIMVTLGIVIIYNIHIRRVKWLKTQKEYLSQEVKLQTVEINAKNEQLENRQDEILDQIDQLGVQAKKLEDSYENIRILSDIGQEITSLLNRGEILSKVYSVINILLDAPVFGIGLYNENSNMLDYMSYNINNKRKEGVELSLDNERFSCWVIKNKKSIWLGKIENEYHKHISSLKEYKENELLKSLMCIPMITDGKVLGVVIIQSNKEYAYSKYHYDILSTLTSYITAAINNANSYSVLEQKVDERTADVNKAYAELVLTNNNFDEFTYRSAHDLRGPLARILGLCQLGIIETNDKKGQEYLAHLEKEAFEMDSMLSRLLRTHHNKTRDLLISTVFISQVVEQVLLSINTKRKVNDINVSIDIPEELTFETDQFLFSIMIESVLDNAIQFQDLSKKEQLLKIKAEKINTNHIKIVVYDNGLGINKDIQEEIFDMFFVGSDITNGSGLGLYEATIIANKLNGYIKLLHSDKEYTEFEIFI